METARFFATVMLAILLLRSFVVAPFSIPSESMLPRLFVGDYLLVAKWPYGYSRWSLPWGVPLIPGHPFARAPARGDVVVFRSPGEDSHDVIKRVIGLAGDTIQMRRGQVILNGHAVPQTRVADFTIPLTPNFERCPPGHQEMHEALGAGRPICRWARYRETLPSGRSYFVLDTGPGDGDDTGLYSVPAGDVFLLGDNRDNSADSRFPAPTGMGYIPADRIEGRAAVSIFSTDGSASWWRPWTWVTAARPRRIGEGF